MLPNLDHHVDNFSQIGPILFILDSDHPSVDDVQVERHKGDYPKPEQDDVAGLPVAREVVSLTGQVA